MLSACCECKQLASLQPRLPSLFHRAPVSSLRFSASQSVEHMHDCHAAEYITYTNKKHLKNVGPIRHNEPPHAHSPDVTSGTVARRLRIDVHDDIDDDNDNNNEWQRGPLWPHGMGPINTEW